MNSIIVELRRRNVLRVAGLYGVVGWLLAQVAVIMETAFHLPSWFDALVISILLLGFPVALIIGWAFELTPDGVKRTDPTEPVDPVRSARKKRRLEAYIAVAAVALVGVFFIGRTTAPDAPPIDRAASIAVTPFADMSADGTQRYFADGIAEELLNLLARSPGLTVASRTSAFSFRDSQTPVREIGQQLGVDHVLEGSVRTSGGDNGMTIRITAQLINAQDDVQLWSETFDRPLSASNIFEVQDEIASSIVSELQGRLSGAPVADRPTDNTDAYTAYLKAKSEAATRTRAGIETAIAEATKAITLDPGFARAHAQLAYTYTLARYYSIMDKVESLDLAARSIDTALALAPDDPEVRLLKAWTTYAVHDAPNEESRAMFAALVAEQPDNAEAWRGLSMSRDSREGRREAITRAAELDPRSTIILINLAQQSAEAGDVDAAINVLKQVLRVEPGNPTALSQLSYYLNDRGDLLEAHRITKQAGDDPQSQNGLRAIYFPLAMWEEAEATGDGALALTQVAKAVSENDWDSARRRLALLPADNPFVLPMHFLTDTAEQLESTLDRNPGTREYLSKDDPIRDFTTASYSLSYYRTLRDRDPETASQIRNRLKDYFETPVKQRHDSVMWNAMYARWHALEGRPAEMDKALERHLELGVPLTTVRYQEFQPHEGRSEVKALRARSDKLAEELRGQVRAELENPPDVWWTP